jgi:uncharacterized protein YdaU (DUF1376 family)
VQKILGNSPEIAENRRDADGAINTADASLTTPREEGAEMADTDSTPGKSPAFQFYPNDFLADANVIVMSMQERGVYITLLCVCWQQGSLPSNVEALSRLCGMPIAAFRRLWPAVEKCFRTTGEKMVNPRLDRERKKQREYRRRQSDNGKLGGRPRKPPESQTKAVGFPGLSQVEPKKSSSIFNLRSSSSDSSHTSARERDEIGERAGTFVNETYPALYAKFRKGARYVGRPALDFQEAMTLCRTWDDERLAKLATVFLTTDHEFAEKGSRTMAQFRSMASWCDSKLAEAGIA